MSFTDEEIAYLRSQFIARSIRIYGSAGRPVERHGMVGPGILTRTQATVDNTHLGGSP